MQSCMMHPVIEPYQSIPWTYVHDERFGLNFGHEGNVGEDVGPAWPPVHVGAQDSHAYRSHAFCQTACSIAALPHAV